MPSKYQIISELASQTARDITSKAERYTDFLVTAANNYKYSFKEQLLIHKKQLAKLNKLRVMAEMLELVF